ncbi:hypothetical protein V3C99_010709 [Haemonchus contortus]|uniref:DUF229 domain containing protein n=1 Tax=Haemonchus contortus TaxID=6289 RepID=A0A7I4Y9T8_HAECO
MGTAKRKIHANKIFVAVLLISFFIALVYIYCSGLEEILTFGAEVFLNSSANISIFDKCPLIIYDHLDPQILKFHHPNVNTKANCKEYKPLTILVNGTLQIAKCLFNDRDRYYIATPWIQLPSNETFECDIIESRCLPDGGFFKNEHSFIHMQIYENDSLISSVDSRPHVYILILDSVSSAMAKRALPETLAYLKTELQAVQMEFYDKVAHNSKPNAFPLFFGKSIEGGSRAFFGLPPLIPDWNETEICIEYLDKYSYELEEYRQSGYKTMVAQDWDVGFVFYKNCTGFKRPEADHMWRPFDIRMEETYTLRRLYSKYCGEHHLFMLEYMEKFMRSYPGVPKICHVWPVYLAHDTMRTIYHTDSQFLDFFKRNTGPLDDAFLFFFADHGPRDRAMDIVPLGRYEKSNPFLIVSIPKRYRNTSIHEQLMKKSRELVTPFDLHATFMDILKLQPSSNFTDTSYKKMEPLSKGSSLLREWRGPRNCRTLPIPAEYCLCQYNKTKIEDKVEQERAGRFLAEQLNVLLKNEGIDKKCQNQTYHSTYSATETRDGDVSLYEIVVRFTPADGYFMAHLRQTDSGFVLYSGITRINEDEYHSKCLRNHPLSPLCYCYPETRKT